MKEQPLNTVRLLPWAGTAGRPCYVVGNGDGKVSREADKVEAMQLGMAYDAFEPGHPSGPGLVRLRP
ncbi:hypothetical protein ACIBQ3_05065 [Streptomyces rubiginosohelvolus]|uniref:hypothetical protein n=1 Tax=Streptomyces rubiginosohelvolus TaxID=67362 RepID=UPI0037A1A41F